MSLSIRRVVAHLVNIKPATPVGIRLHLYLAAYHRDLFSRGMPGNKIYHEELSPHVLELASHQLQDVGHLCDFLRLQCTGEER